MRRGQSSERTRRIQKMDLWRKSRRITTVRFRPHASTMRAWHRQGSAIAWLRRTDLRRATRNLESVSDEIDRVRMIQATETLPSPGKGESRACLPFAEVAPPDVNAGGRIAGSGGSHSASAPDQPIGILEEITKIGTPELSSQILPNKISFVQFSGGHFRQIIPCRLAFVPPKHQPHRRWQRAR